MRTHPRQKPRSFGGRARCPGADELTQVDQSARDQRALHAATRPWFGPVRPGFHVGAGGRLCRGGGAARISGPRDAVSQECGEQAGEAQEVAAFLV